MTMRNIQVTEDIIIGANEPLVMLSGPCVIESEEHTLFCAAELQKIFAPFNKIFSGGFKAKRAATETDEGATPASN